VDKNDRLKMAFAKGLQRNINDISEDLKEGDLNWDSVATVEIALAIEEEFSVSIEPHEFDIQSFKNAKFMLEDKGIVF